MITSSFVEDSLILTPKTILQNLESGMRIGEIAYKKSHPDMDYAWEDPNNPSVALVSIKKGEPQRISLEWSEITFGEKAYFRCECGQRATKFYLPQNCSKFMCRRCHGLKYQLSSIDRRSVAGKTIYRLNRLQKLADSRADMSRILYRGIYSKKFERLIRMCDKAGLNSIVQGANDLKALLKG